MLTYSSAALIGCGYILKLSHFSLREKCSFTCSFPDQYQTLICLFSVYFQDFKFDRTLLAV